MREFKKTGGEWIVVHHDKNLYFQNNLAGIGTLDSPGCQRVIEPVSYLFCINPSTKKWKDMQINIPFGSNAKNAGNISDAFITICSTFTHRLQPWFSGSDRC